VGFHIWLLTAVGISDGLDRIFPEGCVAILGHEAVRRK
jgi:hypothetical protein